MNTIKYSSYKNEHSIFIGNKILKKSLDKFLKEKSYTKIIFIIDKNLFTQFNNIFPDVSNVIKYDVNPHKKDLKEAEKIVALLHKYEANRSTCVVCIGGGTLSDLCGYVSSIYMRGIDYIQVGTTFMSQADAVASKVAVNLENNKNICGAFYSPVITICDTEFLTIGEKLYLDFSEHLKHILISDIKMDSNISKELLPSIIYESLSVKIDAVKNDFFDKSGSQKSLSLGHTIANILEKNSNISHGEAVYIGMLIILSISEDIYNLSSIYRKWVSEAIEKYKIELPVIKLSINDIKQALLQDKISNGESISLVLLKNKGHVIVNNNVDFETIIKSFKLCDYITLLDK